MPGGLSDKLGNRFEDRWAVRCAFEVLNDRAESIRLEPCGPGDDGVEFWVRFSDRVEYHQCKRQRTGEGHWTLPALDAAGVLPTFLDKLSDMGAICLFVSTHAADTLDELSERARQATSAEEFETSYVASAEWRTNFDQLRRIWGNLDVKATYEALRRVFVRTIGEAELAALNNLQAEVGVAGDTDKFVPVLTEVLRERSGTFLTPNDLWPELKKAGYQPNPWRATQSLAVRIESANRHFISSRESTLIGGSLIDRAEARRLRELTAKQSVVFVDGDAGSGKSGVLLQFIRDLEENGVPHLALRLDRISPTHLPRLVGEELDLPASPVVALTAHAQNQPAVLVIDQLDVVSASSGRNPEFLDCVTDMLEAAAGVPTLSVVLSCRTFDLQNDVRLRRIIAKQSARSFVTIGPLLPTQVVETVRALGFNSAGLTESQMNILATPLHLALLGEIAPALRGESRDLSFTTVRDLFEAFWDHKRIEVQDRLGRLPAWTNVLDVLADFMSDNQVLRAPSEIADEWGIDLAAMISSRVVTKDGPHVAFFHEAFFDYVLARRFAGRQKTIAELLAIDQGLFRRAQVRQILAYNRGRAERYREDLEFLVTDPTVRFHLREIVIAWLAQVSPGAEEWQLLRPILDDQDSPLNPSAWRTVSTPNWFATVDSSGYLQACLDSGDDVRLGHALDVLAAGSGQAVDRVLELLEPHIGESLDWNNRLSSFLSRIELTAQRPLFDLLLRLVDSGLLVDTGPVVQNIWYELDHVAREEPAWANEFLGHFLSERLAAAVKARTRNIFDQDANIMPRVHGLRDFICEAAGADPASFFKEVWPTFKLIVERALVEERDNRLSPDIIWPFRHLRNGAHDFHDDLLAGAERAFASLAQNSPGGFSDLFDSLATTRSESIVYLIFEGLAANPEKFADKAIGKLATDSSWLRVSWSNGSEWGTRRLLEYITPFASDEALKRLEGVILAYYPAWERSVGGYREHGWAQFTLLGGIVPDRRSEVVEGRLSEWRRKFRVADVPPPLGIVGGVVRSPIGNANASKMSDANWLTAMARYADERRLGGSTDFLVGGARQLANVLEVQAKGDPDRFAQLALVLPDSANPLYFSALLRGVADSDIKLSVERTEALLLRCHQIAGRPCGDSIARPLLRVVETPLSEKMVELITWYAKSDPDPAPDYSSEAPEVDDIDERLLYRGVNSVRGRIAEAVVQLIWHNKANVDPLSDAVESLTGDPDMGVRAAAAQIAVALLPTVPEKAAEAFERLISDAPDELLANRYIYQFLSYRIAVDFDRFRPVLIRMIESPIGDVQHNGAALATLAALSLEAAFDLAETCIRGTENLRLGAARVYAANIVSSRFTRKCGEALIELFDDDSPLVRDVAASSIRELSGSQLGELSPIVESLITSKAAAGNWDQIFESLLRATTNVAGLSLLACEQALKTSQEDLDGSIGYRMDLLSQILLRVYTDGVGESRARALDLIDWSLQQDNRIVRRALALHDRG